MGGLSLPRWFHFCSILFIFFYRCQIIHKMEVPQVVCNRVGSLNSFFRLLQRKETDSLDGTLYSLPRYFSSPPLAREREERAWNLSRCSPRQVRQIDSLPPTIHIVTVTAYFSPWTYVLRPPSISKNCRFSTSTINTLSPLYFLLGFAPHRNIRLSSCIRTHTYTYIHTSTHAHKTGYHLSK